MELRDVVGRPMRRRMCGMSVLVLWGSLGGDTVGMVAWGLLVLVVCGLLWRTSSLRFDARRVKCVMSVFVCLSLFVLLRSSGEKQVYMFQLS